MSNLAPLKTVFDCLRNFEKITRSDNGRKDSPKKETVFEIGPGNRDFEAKFLAVVEKITTDHKKRKQTLKQGAHCSGEKSSRKKKNGQTPSRKKESEDALCFERMSMEPCEITVQKIRDCVDAIRSSRQIERLARYNWPEEAFQITDIVYSIAMRRNNLQVLIIEDGNEADLDFYDTIGFEVPEVHLADNLKPGNAISVTTEISAAKEKESEAVALDKLSSYLIVGKMKTGRDKARALISMVERMRVILEKAFPESAELPQDKTLSIALHLPSTVEESIGRVIVECSWRNLGLKIHVCRRPKKRREDEPRSRLSILSIRAQANTGFKYLKVVADLKEKVPPSSCGVEVHKISHASVGDVQLRIKENEIGGKRKFAIKIREALGFHCCFT